MQRLRFRGFSLIELMVTLALIAGTLAMAAPTMGDWLVKSQQRNLATAIGNTVTRARTEAIRRNARVTVCVSADQKTCTKSGDWRQGWIIFIDTNNGNKLEASDTIIHYESGGNFSNVTAIVKSSNPERNPMRDYISFAGSGMPQRLSGALLMGTITVCAPGQNAIDVVIAATGRTRIEPTSTPCP